MEFQGKITYMKIFVIGTRGFPGVQGGLEKHCEELYKRLAKYHNIELTALVISKYYKNKIKEWNGIKFIYIKSLNSKYFEKLFYGFVASIIAVIKRPDIIHFHATNCALYIPLLKLLGIKIILTYQSRDYLYPKWGKIAKFVIRVVLEKTALKSDKIIAVSDTINNHLKKYTDKSVVIHNGVNINHQEISKKEVEGFLSKYGLEKNCYIFFAGRFTEEKAIEDLIEAYNQSDLDNEKIKLVIAGDADHETKYSRMIKDIAKNSTNIILTGFITGREIQTLFSNAKLFVLPSKHEGLPIALLEALSYGVEVLASNIDANMQIDIGENNFFEQGNIDDLKRRMLCFLNAKITEEEQKRRLEMLKKDYSWDEISTKIYKLYEELI